MSISNLYPSTSPSLSLDFAAVKKLDSRVSFTRTTTATYYNGVTTAKAEENLLLQSQDFTTSWSTINSTVTANTEVAPDGTTTAETITDNATSGTHSITQTPTCVASVPYTFSAFLKEGTNQYACVLMFSTTANENYVTAIVDLNAGTISKSQNGTSTTSASTSIVSVGNGWYRVSVTGTAASAFTRARIGLVNSGTPTIAVNGLPADYVGTGTTIYAWGAQLEQRSAVTAYTPTTTQPITNYIPVLLTAASGVARFDHNPTTGESLGLLVEEQRTNLLTYSAEFDNAAWVKAALNISANTAVAPDGTLSADGIVPTTASAAHFLDSIAISFTSGTAYTQSVYAKALGTAGYRLRLRFNAAAFTSITTADFDLVSGTVTGTIGTITASITPVGNGWYRCAATATATATTTSDIYLLILSSNGTQTHAGDGFSGALLWGAQLEAGAFPTSYIPTVAATVTRNADAASMTGTNFSSWFNQQQGSLYLDTTPRHTGTQYPAIIGDGTSATLGIGFFTEAGNLQARVRGTGGSSTIAGGIAITANTAFKAMLSYAAYNNAWAYNGANRATGNTNIKPENSSTLQIGSDPLSSNVYTGTIKKLSFYPIKLTDAQLNALTS